MYELQCVEKVHIYYKIVTKTGQCFAHSGKMKLSNTQLWKLTRLWQYLSSKQSDILALSLAKTAFQKQKGK